MKPIKALPMANVVAFLRSFDKQTWLIIVLGTGIFLLSLFFLAIPAWIERPALRRDIQSMSGQIRQVNELNKNRARWEEDRKMFSALIETTRARVFSKEDMELLLGLVSKMASEARVDVLASKPLTEKAVFGAPYHLQYQPNGYEFSVQGGYHHLGDFLSRIEAHDKLLRVRSLEIIPAEKTPDRHIANLTLWAIIKAPPPPPPPAKKAPKGKNVPKKK
ncbi:MAG: type 4a pilus biogenesis protein PilO [Candidatus Omnitrophota bacterium]